MDRTLETGKPLRPNKRLGQNFLVDPDISAKIVNLSNFSRKDTVLEIGPGKGALTFPLARRVKHVLAVEKDARLAEWLKDGLKRAGIGNVTLLNADILKLDWLLLKEYFENRMPVIGNLPYNISTPVLERMCRNPQWLGRALLMFQKEVAERLTAAPGSKAYGALSLLVQYQAKVEPRLRVSRGSFFPVPRVDSMVIAFDFEAPYPVRTENHALFEKVVKGAFSHRRKTILNSLKRGLPNQTGESILKALSSCGIDPGNRAEVLEMQDFLRLSSVLQLTKGLTG